MKTLSFYPFRPDGTSGAACLADIADAGAEVLFVRQMFETYDTAEFIEVFEENALLRRYERGNPRPVSGPVSASKKSVSRRSMA